MFFGEIFLNYLKNPCSLTACTGYRMNFISTVQSTRLHSHTRISSKLAKANLSKCTVRPDHVNFILTFATDSSRVVNPDPNTVPEF
jgi:hypothetical protein